MSRHPVEYCYISVNALLNLEKSELYEKINIYITNHFLNIEDDA